jgi:hypothetical protein
MPTHSKFWPWDLLIVIAYAGMIGNYLRFNTKRRLTSLRAKSILGIKTISPLRYELLDFDFLELHDDVENC